MFMSRPTENKQECNTVSDQKCSILFKKKCSGGVERKCETVTDTINDQVILRMVLECISLTCLAQSLYSLDKQFNYKAHASTPRPGAIIYKQLKF